jgi:probable phosphoglycerate mutase
MADSAGSPSAVGEDGQSSSGPAEGSAPAASTGTVASERADPPCLVVVRHGQTEWSRSGRHTGRTDIPVDEVGEEQAAALRPLLDHQDFAAVWTSPLERARRTAALAGFGDEAIEVPDLAEWDYGAYEGITTDEIRQMRPRWSLWDDGVEGGESLADVALRAQRVVDAARAQRGSVLAFAHGHILRVVAARWLDLAPAEGRRFVLGAGRVGVLGWEHRAPALLGWNVGAHPTLTG